MVDFVAALISIAFAYKLGWTAHELVWGFWLMGLVRGLAHGILLQGVVYKDHRENSHSLNVTADTLMAINLVLAFMYAHFLFLHVGIAFFVHGFFPVIEVPKETIGMIAPLTKEVLSKQWPMAVLAIVMAAAHKPNVPGKMLWDTAKSIYGSVLRIQALMVLLIIMTWAKRPPLELYVMITLVFLPFGGFNRKSTSALD